MTRALCVGLMTPHESLTARSPSLAWARPLGSCLEAAACHESLRPIGRALRRGQESRPLPVLPGNRDMDRALCTKEPYLNTGVATVTGFAGESRYGTRLVYKGTISQYRRPAPSASATAGDGSMRPNGRALRRGRETRAERVGNGWCWRPETYRSGTPSGSEDPRRAQTGGARGTPG
jgi:hypothetical protein